MENDHLEKSPIPPDADNAENSAARKKLLNAFESLKKGSLH
jgi:hypothetical protein